MELSQRPQMRVPRASLHSRSPYEPSVSSTEDSGNSSSSKLRSSDLPQPGSGAKVLKEFRAELTPQEREEIRYYKEVYYLGLHALKPEAVEENGHLLVACSDHVAYRYEILEELAFSKFSKVYSAFDHKEKKVVALKVIRNEGRLFEQALTEVKVLNCLAATFLSTSHAVRLLADFEFRGHRVLVFPLLSHTLYQHIKSHPSLTGRSLSLVVHQLVSGVAQYHRKGIIHCDLKPENIMFSQADDTELKIIDFGVACFKHKKVYRCVQSQYYRAPEVLLGCAYTPAIDVWSLGCVLAEIHTGHVLFRGRNEHEQFLRIVEYLGHCPSSMIREARNAQQFYKTIDELDLLPGFEPGSKSLSCLIRDPGLLDLIQHCLRWDPKTRITAEAACAHPFVTAVFGSKARPRNSVV